MRSLNEACTPKPSVFDDAAWLGLKKDIGDRAGMGSMSIVQQLGRWVKDGHKLFEDHSVHTAADRVALLVEGYVECCKGGWSDPPPLWVVQKGCAVRAKRRKSSPGLPELKPMVKVQRNGAPRRWGS